MLAMCRERVLFALIALGALLAALALPASAELSASDEALAGRYRAALRAAQSGAGSRALEAAFDALTAFAQAVLRPRDGSSALESLTDPEFARLQRSLPGVQLWRVEAVAVAADPVFFARLAERHGDAADRAFFAALRATHPDGAWPVYVEQQTDVSGCTRFGSMTLAGTHARWRRFQAAHPGRYAAAAHAEAAAVVDELTGSTCACGGLDGVQAELQRFVRRTPASEARNAVQQRLDAVRNGSAGVRAFCVAG